MLKVEPMPGNPDRKFKATAQGQSEYFYSAGAALFWAETVDGIVKSRQIRGAK